MFRHGLTEALGPAFCTIFWNPQRNKFYSYVEVKKNSEGTGYFCCKEFFQVGK